jgi:hypothetical protein
MALTTFKPTIVSRIAGKAAKSAAGVGSVSFLLSHDLVSRLTVADCDQVYTATRTLAGGASENLDLAGSLVSPLGETVTLARVKAILVELLDTTAASSIDVGVTVANQVPGLPAARLNNRASVLAQCDDATGWPVTAGTGDLYRITNNDGAVTATYRITILGSTT